MQQRTHDRDRIWAEWMRAANAGDEIAYRRLLEALAPVLRQIVRRGFTRSGFGNGDVEDVVQETLLAIHLKRQTWDDVELPIDDFLDVLPAEIPSESLSSRDAERLLSVLSGRQRDVVRAISIEGMSAREAADRFRISEGAVRVALHRGLSALAVSRRDFDQ